MTRLPVGMIILLIVSALIFFGLAQRALDRMKLSDKGALAVIAGLIIGSFIDIPIRGGAYPVTVNAGGALIPLGLAVYLVATAGTATEKIRALAGSAITAVVIFGLGALLMRGLTEPAGRFGFLDAIWLFPLVAGIVGYLSGRSRRGAFVAATLGMLAFDAGYYAWLVNKGAPAGRVDIGGAGAFDAVVIAGIFAILLAETVGEALERTAGGPVEEGKAQSLISALRKPDLERGAETGTRREEDGKNRRQGVFWQRKDREGENERGVRE
ncbi:MAG: DUF1614 domain-containing protein [Peptococcaceae bacterium]|nr:DUF1614 domain-containing protein [Peptococcaceae bacterium]